MACSEGRGRGGDRTEGEAFVLPALRPLRLCARKNSRPMLCGERVGRPGTGLARAEAPRPQRTGIAFQFKIVFSVFSTAPRETFGDHGWRGTHSTNRSPLWE